MTEPLRQPGASTDQLIAALFAVLPPPGTVWTEAKRKRWLAVAEAVFDIVYQVPTEH